MKMVVGGSCLIPICGFVQLFDFASLDFKRKKNTFMDVVKVKMRNYVHMYEGDFLIDIDIDIYAQ